MKPITDVLRETENLNLAPEVLEPEAQSIEKVQSSGIARNFGIRIWHKYHTNENLNPNNNFDCFG